VARLIGQQRPPGGCAFTFEDLEARARTLLEQARHEARRLHEAALEAAAAAVAAEKQRGYLRGLEEGRAAGLEQARREAAQTALQEARESLASLAAGLTAAMRDFEQAKRRLIASAEAELIGLALAIARRVCKTQAAGGTGVAQANVRHLLELVRHEHDLQLRLHPADAEALREALPELLTEAESVAHVELIADESVGRGGCVLVSRRGTIDATLDTQLDRIAEALTGRPQPGESVDPQRVPS
jgi:flagellar biosynthesis/type III secretory pathway protein FliH